MRLPAMLALLWLLCAAVPARGQTYQFCDLTFQDPSCDLSGPFYLGPLDAAPCPYAVADPLKLQILMIGPWGNAYWLGFETAGNLLPLEVRANGELVGTTSAGGSCEGSDYAHNEFEVGPYLPGDPEVYVLIEIGLPEGSEPNEHVHIRNLSVFGYWVTPTQHHTWGSLKARF